MIITIPSLTEIHVSIAPLPSQVSVGLLMVIRLQETPISQAVVPIMNCGTISGMLQLLSKGILRESHMLPIISPQTVVAYMSANVPTTKI